MLGINEPIKKPEQKEVTVHAKRETCTAQVLVMTKERTEMQYQYNEMIATMAATNPYPFQELSRIINSGKYKLELVVPYMQPGMPTLIIHEE